ncbi:hypothetical protein HPB48_011281 [Haemaphysalis longicornis]|uniref:Sulfatase N-terminal domain-containing protein n=1 Tax=Haemaphysalis longicornis TaxID=44386 RepID=A0A9J6G3M7_HAELO|nr:hypothetical protein HPB48_011281 [Haemaphysalis longicornis]
MMDTLDQSVGVVMEALYEAQMLDNSIVVFSSDNGGSPFGFHASRSFNWPLRGSKGTHWEGGTRAAAFIWSPLLRKRRRVSPQMMHISDWLPTLYHAAVLYNIEPQQCTAALRYGNYKLVEGVTFGGTWDGRYLTPRRNAPPTQTRPNHGKLDGGAGTQGAVSWLAMSHDDARHVRRRTPRGLERWRHRLDGRPSALYGLVRGDPTYPPLNYHTSYS